MNRRRGSLLVMTLWIVTILGALSVAVARYLSTEVRLTRYRLARQQARELARSGVYLAQQLIQKDGNDDNPQVDWSNEEQQPWAKLQTVSLAAGRDLTVEITDEERKLNVNAASADQLESLLGSGSRPLAEAIVAYADPDPDGPAESPVETPPYYPKNAPVIVLEELRDLPGMTDEAFIALQQFTFAAPGASATLTVNINTATREVLQAAGLPMLADAIIAFREQGHYFTSLTPLVTENPAVPPPFDPADSEFQTALGRLVVASKLFLVRATGSMTQPPGHYHIEAVIQRSTDPASPTPKIIAWKEH